MGLQKEALRHVEEHYLEFGRKLEPIENALQNAKSLIKNCLDAIKKEYPWRRGRVHDIYIG